MNQRINGRSAVFATTVLLLGSLATVRAQDISVSVDSAPVTFAEQAPILEPGGRVLVPLRGVFEKLGANVNYDAATRTVTATRAASGNHEATSISLPVGSNSAKVNDKTITLDAPTTATNGSVLVPLRFVSEALGAKVQFQPESRSVAVTTDDSAASETTSSTGSESQTAPESVPPSTANPPGPAGAAATPEAMATESPAAAATTTPQQVEPATGAPAAAEAQTSAPAENSSLLRYLPWLLVPLAIAALAFFLTRQRPGQVIAAGAKGSETKTTTTTNKKI